MLPIEPSFAQRPPVLLGDEAMRTFITNGYLILHSDVPQQVHAAIYERLQWILHQEGNPGNNILPAVPEMQQVLDSPTVRGALVSVLGRNYVLHPHRFVHNNEPGGEVTAEGARMGKGSASFIGWHQDSHSPLARPRHHYPRYAMILYYPQDTPDEMGPTQIIPATHLNRTITDVDRERGLLGSGPAGTCVLVHFDLAHGGSFNSADRTRHMAKFVFARVEEPTEPTWNNTEEEWYTPVGSRAPCQSRVVWEHQWHWLRGKGQTRPARHDGVVAGSQQIADLLRPLDRERPMAERVEAMQRLATAGADAAPAIPALLAAMSEPDPIRQNAIYTLAAIGEPAIGPLTEHLVRRQIDGWNEHALVAEESAYALAAIGVPAVPALVRLLEEGSEWVQINALFALGEMGPRAQAAYPAILAQLRHPAHPVVRTALDALGQVGVLNDDALPEFARILQDTNPDWQTPLYRTWTGQDQARTNAMMALLRLKPETQPWLDLIAHALADPCGYVGGFGVEILRRRNTPQALQAALDYLTTHRWDDSLKKGVRTF